MAVDPLSVADLVREVAEAIVRPRYRQLEVGDIQEKQKGDLVTIADLETEQWLTERLTNLLPGSAVVGEEAVFADPGILKWMASDDPVWVVDPIDGTWNFAHGKDAFAIIVALRLGGETVMGWIFEPVFGTMAIGEHGGGVVVDGQPVDFTVEKSAPDAPLSGTAARYLYDRAVAADERIVSEVFRPSSAGHEYVLILQGERQFSAYTRLLPWDHAAGSFMLTEAGGVSRLLTGAPYDPARPVGDLLTSFNAASWQCLQELLVG